jgi:uncharacterized membrane-anchored protein
MQQPIKVIKDWIHLIQTEGQDLTSWEEDFVESLNEQIKRSGRISERQEEILDKIYTEKTP